MTFRNIKDPSLLKALILILPGCAYWKDLEGVYQGCNAEMAALAGLDSPAKIIGKTDHDLPWREQECVLWAHDKTVMTTNTEKTVQENRKLANGCVVTCLTTRRPLQNAKGQIIGVLGICLESSSTVSQDERVAEKSAQFHRKVAELWNKNADAWCEASSKGLDVWRDCLNTPAFLNMLPDISNLIGLDIGCGDGHNSRLVAQLCKSLTAVDIADAFIQYNLNNSLPENLSFKKVNATDLPFFNESFDFVVATMSFMDMAEFEKVLTEAHRVLVPNGFLQFSLIHPAFNEHLGEWVRDDKGKPLGFLMKDYFKENMGEIHEWQHVNAPSTMKKFKVPRFSKPLSQWLNMLIKAGFSIEEICEPCADEKLIQIHPELASTQVVAHSLIIRVKKNESKEPLRKIIEKLPGNIWWKDNNLKYLGCNDRVIEVLGLKSRKDFVGKNDHQLWSEEVANKLLDADLYVLETGETINLEETIIQGDGSAAIMLTNKSPLRDDAGKIVGIIGTSTDITKRKELEEKLRKTEASEARFKAMSALGGMIAHELRTPLTTIGMGILPVQTLLPQLIAGYEKSVARGEAEPIRPSLLEPLKKSIDYMGRAVNYAQMTISTILAGFHYSDSDATIEIVPFPLKPMIEKAIAEYPFDVNEEGLVTVRSIDDVQVLGGERMVVHVLHNLLKNALHFIHAERKGTISIWSDCDDKTVCLYVEDTAKGIASEQLEHIFDAFYTTKKEAVMSLGLGLYFCKTVLQKMGGDITCESELGQYARFKLRLPLAPGVHNQKR